MNCIVSSQERNSAIKVCFVSTLNSPKAAMKKWHGRIDNVLPMNNVYLSLAVPENQFSN